VTLASSIANDYLFIDGIEDVILTPADGTPTVEAVKALPRTVSYQAVMALGAMPTDLTFHLWASTLDGATPNRGDKITRPDFSDWIITFARLTTLGTRWHCNCTQAASTD
jgi:hypothetical protein